MTTLSWTVVVMIRMYRMGYSYHSCDDYYYDVSITRTMVIAILDQYSPTMFLKEKKADGEDSEPDDDDDDLDDVNHSELRWSLFYCE